MNLQPTLAFWKNEFMDEHKLQNETWHDFQLRKLSNWRCRILNTVTRLNKNYGFDKRHWLIENGNWAGLRQRTSDWNWGESAILKRNCRRKGIHERKSRIRRCFLGSGHRPLRTHKTAFVAIALRIELMCLWRPIGCSCNGSRQIGRDASRARGTMVSVVSRSWFKGIRLGVVKKGGSIKQNRCIWECALHWGLIHAMKILSCLPASFGAS